MKSVKFLMLIAVAAVLASGCNSTAKKILPKHDEVLRYPLSYDLTYMRTLEAVQHVDGWELAGTDMEKGEVELYNLEYGNFSSADQRKISVLVKREGLGITSIQLKPESQQVIGGAEIMKTISSYVSRDLR